MTRGRHFRPAKVFQHGASLAQSFNGSRVAPPAWVKAIQAIPPAEILTRPYPVQHTEPNHAARRPSRRLFQPTQMVYPEDELRRDFFRDHPWELARPRLVLEMDGSDARYRDWSRGIQQPGMKLSGENVVQRQLWLMEVGGLTKAQAYDQARHEFYQLRQQEDIARRVAVEEARHVGAYFGKTFIQVGLDLEDEHFEKWKGWAAQRIQAEETQRAEANTSVVDSKDDISEEEDILANVVA